MKDNKYKVEYINMKKRKITVFTKNNWFRVTRKFLK